MTREYRDFTLNQYRHMRCTSYTGGASWYKSNADQGFYVVACTPVEVNAYFTKHPEGTVRGQFVPFAESHDKRGEKTMTFEQAMQLLERDRKVIEQSLSNLDTAKALHAIGESDKAVELLAQSRSNLRRELSKVYISHD